MSIRLKAIGFLVCAVLGLVVGLHQAVGRVVLDGIRQAEVADMRTQVENVQRLVDTMGGDVTARFRDWSQWDDMVQFAADGNPEFRSSNINPETFTNIEADFMVVVGRDGQEVLAVALDRAGGALAPLPDEVRAHLRADGLLRGTGDSAPAFQGLINLSGGLHVFCSLPILHSSGAQGEFPARLIVGRRAGETWAARLRTFTGLEIALAPLAADDVPTDVGEARARLRAGAATWVELASPERIAGYGLVEDLYGAPVASLAIYAGRPIAAHGEEIRQAAVGVIALGGLVLLLVAVTLVNLTWLRPLDRIARSVTALERRAGRHRAGYAGRARRAGAGLRPDVPGAREPNSGAGPRELCARRARRAARLRARQRRPGLHPDEPRRDPRRRALARGGGVVRTPETRRSGLEFPGRPRGGAAVSPGLRGGVRRDPAHRGHAGSDPPALAPGRPILLARLSAALVPVRASGAVGARHQRHLGSGRVRAPGERAPGGAPALRALSRRSPGPVRVPRRGHPHRGQAGHGSGPRPRGRGPRSPHAEGQLGHLRHRPPDVGLPGPGGATGAERRPPLGGRARAPGGRVVPARRARRAAAGTHAADRHHPLARGPGRARGGHPRRDLAPGGLLGLVEDLALEPVGDRLNRLAQQTRSTAERLGKFNVQVTTDLAPEPIRLPVEEWASFWSSFAHMVRNTIDHGVEPPLDRLGLGKAADASVTYRARWTPTEFILDVIDDGPGIDWAAIQTRAAARGLDTGTHEALVEALFAPGITSRDAATTTSGRGLGLDVVRAEVLALGGHLRVHETPGGGTTFRFTLPRQDQGARMSLVRPIDRSVGASRTVL